MGSLNAINLMLGLWLLAVGSWTPVGAISIEEQLEMDINNLRNDTVEGYFNIPKTNLSNITALDYYNVVNSSEGEDGIGLSLRYVAAMGYGKPSPFGNCDQGPVWAVHHVPGYLFWPPIPKRVCHRPSPIYGQRCRPSCSEMRYIFRYVWKITYYYNYYICQLVGWERICYEQHNCWRTACGYNLPYCYL